jgi:hypothetical protein
VDLTMADEIRNQNVVTVTLEGDIWCARIGPRGQGLEGRATHPARALRALAAAVEIKGWPFDPTYVPKPEPTFHDA